MIAIILFLISVYLAVSFLIIYRVAMVDLLQNLQDIYAKWEEKSRPKVHSTSLEEHDTRLAATNGTLVPGLCNNNKESLVKAAPRRRFSTTDITPQRRKTSHIVRKFSTVGMWNGLGQFKNSPSLLPDMSMLRPQMGNTCPTCFPASRITQLAEPDSALGMTNFLNVPTQNSDRNILVRSFCYAAMSLRTPMPNHYPDVSNKVLYCEKVQEAIEKAATEELEENEVSQNALPELREKHKNRAIEAIRRMRTCLTSYLLRLAAWILFKIFNRMLTNIQVHKGQLEVLKKVSKKNVPILYLPTHRSHLDYIILSFVVCMNSIRAPVVAAGDNLLIPFFGTLLRGLGAFFIKRKLDPKNGKKDHVYRAVLQCYMAENLKAGQSMEFFVEGGRSRSGKSCLPKSGLLSVVVDCVAEGIVDDVYVCPVSISYEKIMDGNYVSEQLGKPKVVESFSGAAKAIWRTLHSCYGGIRVDFCRPFSLKEYLQSVKNCHMAAVHQLSQRVTLPLSSSRPLYSVPSTGSLYGVDVVSEDYRQIIKELAEHVVYDFTASSSIMSTNLVAFLLLTKHRKGATMQHLVQSMNWIRDEFSSRKRDVGFTGDSVDVIKQACHYLGKDCVSTETFQMAWSSGDSENANVKIVFVKPAITLPHVLELQYYANAVLPVFLMDSVVVNATYAALDMDLDAFHGIDSQLTVSRKQLINKTLEMCDILQYEFIFAPPCADLVQVINETIDRLVSKELLSTVSGVKSIGGHSWNRVASTRHYEWEPSSGDDEEEEFNQDEHLRVNLGDDSECMLQYLRCILSPFIESYWLAACSLMKLVHTQKDESAFVKLMHKVAQEKLHQGLLLFEESFAFEPLKNAMKLFEHWNVLESHMQDSVKVVYLSGEYDSEEAVSDVILRIEQFKK